MTPRCGISSSSSCIASATSRSNAGSSTADMDVSASVKTNVKTTNGMIRPDTFRVIAGPCTVEGYEQFVASARAVKQAGFDYVRGGAFKPRTSPYSFQGLGGEGLTVL